MTDAPQTLSESPRRRVARTREELLDALAEFDAEAIISLIRPGRLAEWKQRLFEHRSEFEEAERAYQAVLAEGMER